MLPLLMMRFVTSKPSEPSSDRARSSPPTESPRSWVDEHDPLEPGGPRDRLGRVGVAPDAVADVRLVGEAEAEEVEEHDPAARGPDRLDHARASRTSTSGTRAGRAAGHPTRAAVAGASSTNTSSPSTVIRCPRAAQSATAFETMAALLSGRARRLTGRLPPVRETPSMTDAPGARATSSASTGASPS